MGDDMYELQRYDASWGGWRAVAKAFDNDSPARFETQAQAVAAMKSMQPSSYKYRVKHLVLGAQNR